jgi:hypothetical protein
MQIEPLPEEEIEKIFSMADPVLIPEEFIDMVQLRTLNGERITLTGAEFKDFVKSKKVRSLLGSVEVCLNLNKFSKALREQTEDILLEVKPAVIE